MKKIIIGMLLCIHTFLIAMEDKEPLVHLEELQKKLCTYAARHNSKELTPAQEEYKRYSDKLLQETNNELVFGVKTAEFVKTHQQWTYYSALLSALKQSQFESAESLINHPITKLDLAEWNEHEETESLLHIVCNGKWHTDDNKTKQLIQSLLNLGAPINHVRKSDNTTALDITKLNGTTPASIGKFLKSKGASYSSDLA